MGGADGIGPGGEDRIVDVVGGQVHPSAAIVHIAVGLDQHECIGARLAEESVDIRQPEAVRTMMPKNNSGWLATADLPVLAGRLVTGSQAGYVDGETCGLLKRIWTEMSAWQRRTGYSGTFFRASGAW